MNDDVLVRVENVSKRFCCSLKRSLWYGLQDMGSQIGVRRHGVGSGLPTSSADVHLRSDEFWALKDINLELRRGQCIGILGRNGSGKSTLLRVISGLIKPDTGFLQTRGRVLAMIALGAGFNNILTGRENIYMSASTLGMSYSECDRLIDDIIEFSEIGEFIDTPVQNYSSGMNVRLGFAISTAFQPDILILDEVLAVGDGAFKAKCINRISELKENCVTIFVSHNMLQVRRVCNVIFDLSSKDVVVQSDVASAISSYENRLHEQASKREPVYYFNSSITVAEVSVFPSSNSSLGDHPSLMIALQNSSKEPLKAYYILKISSVCSESACDMVVEGELGFENGCANISVTKEISILTRGSYIIGLVLFKSRNNSQTLLRVENLCTLTSNRDTLHKCPVSIISNQHLLSPTQ